MGWSDIAQGASAVVVACFTGLLVCVARRQARIMKTQAEIQDSTLAATKTAAEAAKNSADMLPKIERAYVFLEGDIKHDIRTLRHDETKRGFNICFTMKNYGKTPAIVGS